MLVAMRWMFLVISMSSAKPSASLRDGCAPEEAACLALEHPLQNVPRITRNHAYRPPRQPLPSEQAVLGIDGSCPEFLVGRTGQPGDHHLRHVAGRTQNFSFPHRRFGVARHHFPKQEPKGRDHLHPRRPLAASRRAMRPTRRGYSRTGRAILWRAVWYPAAKAHSQQEFQYFIIGKRGAVFEKTLAQPGTMSGVVGCIS